ncbi:MAG: hypothetical protein WCS86_03650 [Candidatus Paceibacterota bacterium]
MKENFKEVEIDDLVMIISINKTYKDNLTSDGLYNITHASWKVGPERAKAVFAFATYKGIVKEVYKIHSWSQDVETNSKRWIFDGEIAEDPIRSKYFNKSVKHYRKWGSINPIMYVNCK